MEKTFGEKNINIFTKINLIKRNKNIQIIIAKHHLTNQQGIILNHI
jgi:hypothetical protein